MPVCCAALQQPKGVASDFVHEIALSTQLAHVVQRAAGNRRVYDVHLKIGALRQVVPETLTYAWGFVTKKTPLEQATLSIEWVDAIIECAAGHRRDISGEEYLDLSCHQCPEPTRVIAGEEFSVIDIEVEGEEHGTIPPPR
ncbi:hydrogenase nickel incorporation protein [Corynebacterium felinum]|nr:hydrogenase nickel incorporation protein [Corynebacterium felinum]